MAVPRNRHSNARKNSRRAHDAKKPSHTIACSSCKAPKLPHAICQECGSYAGKQVIATDVE